LLIAGAWIPNKTLQSFDRFDIVRVHVQSRFGQRFDRIQRPGEIGYETFDQYGWFLFLEELYRQRKVLRPTVFNIDDDDDAILAVIY
jgi:hypothetical protein